MVRHHCSYDALPASVIQDTKRRNAGVGSAGERLPALACEAPSFSDEIRAILDQMGVRARRTTLTKGSTISLHGGPSAGLHFLLSGRMKLMWLSEKGQDMVLDLLDPGDVFGEMFLAEECEPSFAEALESVEIETIRRFSVERAWRERPALAIALARLLAYRRNRLERRLGAHVFFRAPTRLALLLLNLAERFGKAVPPLETSAGGVPARLLDIPISQRDLGSLIGASREIVSLTLSEFRRRGAISMLGRRIVVDTNRLRFCANANVGETTGSSRVFLHADSRARRRTDFPRNISGHPEVK